MLICPQHREFSPLPQCQHLLSPVYHLKRKFSLNHHGHSCNSSFIYLNHEKSCTDRRMMQYVCQNFCGIFLNVQKMHIHSLLKNMMFLLQEIALLLSVQFPPLIEEFFLITSLSTTGWWALFVVVQKLIMLCCMVLHLALTWD